MRRVHSYLRWTTLTVFGSGQVKTIKKVGGADSESDGGAAESSTSIIGDRIESGGRAGLVVMDMRPHHNFVKVRLPAVSVCVHASKRSPLTTQAAEQRSSRSAGMATTSSR
jgi:hypothetical protein